MEFDRPVFNGDKGGLFRLALDDDHVKNRLFSSRWGTSRPLKHTHRSGKRRFRRYSHTAGAGSARSGERALPQK